MIAGEMEGWVGVATDEDYENFLNLGISDKLKATVQNITKSAPKVFPTQVVKKVIPVVKIPTAVKRTVNVVKPANVVQTILNRPRPILTKIKDTPKVIIDKVQNLTTANVQESRPAVQVTKPIVTAEQPVIEESLVAMEYPRPDATTKPSTDQGSESEKKEESKLKPVHYVVGGVIVLVVGTVSVMAIRQMLKAQKAAK